MKSRWICDIRTGCVAVYYANKPTTCLSGAREWAKYYRHGYMVAGGWENKKIDEIIGNIYAFVLNILNIKPKNIYS